MVKRITLCLAGVLVLFFAGAALPPEPDSPYERMLDEQRMVNAYLVRQAQEMTDRAAEEIASRDRWEEIREQRREEMLDMLGLWPLPERTPLNPRITGTIDRGGYVIEKIAFESLPRVYVTANFYLPKQREGRLPAVVYVCGHAYGPHGNKAEYQRHPITLAKHGYAALIIDSIQISETFALHHGILNNEMYWWYARGYTPAGVEAWNVVRALDYLETREEVDASRFGITGRSGGAAVSWFSGAVDPRLKVVVPVMGNSTYAANVEANTQRLHCDCMFAVNFRLHGMMHQGALIAPRPLLMMHGRDDKLFPVPGYERFERTLEQLYEGYDAGERFKNLVVEGGHEDSELLRAEAVKWFDRWLKEVPPREIDATVEELPKEKLSVFGGSPPDDARNYLLHEFFAPKAAPPQVTNAAAWRERRGKVMGLLRGKVFGTLPSERVPLDVVPGSLKMPEGFESLAFTSEEGIRVQAAFQDKGEAGRPALLYVASDGEDFQAIRDTLRRMDSNPLMVVWPRGVGEVPWPKKVWKDLLRNAMHTGRTVDSMRVWDVIRAAELLRARTDGAPVAVAGQGISGVLGLYAALLDEPVDHVLLMDPPLTHRDGPVFLNVLRYTDLPEAAALLAPRRLTFYGRVPEEFELTRSVYRLMGAQDRFRLSMSIEAALNGRWGHDFPSGL